MVETLATRTICPTLPLLCLRFLDPRLHGDLDAWYVEVEGRPEDYVTDDVATHRLAGSGTANITLRMRELMDSLKEYGPDRQVVDISVFWGASVRPTHMIRHGALYTPDHSGQKPPAPPAMTFRYMPFDAVTSLISPPMGDERREYFAQLWAQGWRPGLPLTDFDLVTSARIARAEVQETAFVY